MRRLLRVSLAAAVLGLTACLHTAVGRYAHSGVLTLLYDGRAYGGRCEVHLTFVTTVSGNESYTCSDGARGKGRRRIAAR